MSDYNKSRKSDITSSYNKSMGGQGGAKKPKPKKMSAKGKKSSTSSAAVGGAS